MPNTTYTSRKAVTLATRAAAYEKLSEILLHLDALNLNLVSIVRNGDNTVSITVSNPIRADHVDPFDLNGG